MRHIALIGTSELLLRGMEGELGRLGHITCERGLSAGSRPDIVVFAFGGRLEPHQRSAVLVASARFPSARLVLLATASVEAEAMTSLDDVEVIDGRQGREHVLQRLLADGDPVPERHDGAGVDLHHLSDRERAVLDGLASGRSDDQIAHDLGMPTSTVRSHVRRACVKLDLDDRTAMVALLRPAQSSPAVPYESPGVLSRCVSIELVMAPGFRRDAVAAGLQSLPGVASCAERSDTDEVPNDVDRSNTVVLVDWSDPKLHCSSPPVITTLGIGPAEPELVEHALRAGLHGYLSDDADPSQAQRTFGDALRGDLPVPSAVQGALLSGLLTHSAVEDRAIRSLLSLSGRERDILRALCEGVSDAELAERFFISANTVRSHVRAVLSKMGTRSRRELAAVASEHRLVERFLE